MKSYFANDILVWPRQGERCLTTLPAANCQKGLEARENAGSQAIPCFPRVIGFFDLLMPNGLLLLLAFAWLAVSTGILFSVASHVNAPRPCESPMAKTSASILTVSNVVLPIRFLGSKRTHPASNPRLRMAGSKDHLGWNWRHPRCHWDCKRWAY